MRLLFVGNANSFLLINLAIELKKTQEQCRIDIISESFPVSEDAKKAFDTVYAVSKVSKWRNVRFIKVIWYAWQYKMLIKQINEKYDIVHFFYLSAIYRFIWNSLREKAKRTGITVFGSEFYRAGSVIKLLQQKMVGEADFISATNPLTLKDFCEHFGVPENKRYLTRFGLVVIDELPEITSGAIGRFRSELRISPTSLIIACGYNASPNQNLEIIIEQLTTVKKDLNDVVLFFQMPGPSNSSYRESISNKLRLAGFEFRIFDNWMTNEELAIYRKTVNIMIQVQNTDQFSGAMSEHLAAGSKVITGSWLPYAIFDQCGVEYFKIDRLDQIGSKVVEILQCDIDKQKNKTAVEGLCSWRQTIHFWSSLYLHE